MLVIIMEENIELFQLKPIVEYLQTECQGEVGPRPSRQESCYLTPPTPGHTWHWYLLSNTISTTSLNQAHTGRRLVLCKGKSCQDVWKEMIRGLCSGCEGIKSLHIINLESSLCGDKNDFSPVNSSFHFITFSPNLLNFKPSRVRLFSDEVERLEVIVAGQELDRGPGTVGSVGSCEVCVLRWPLSPDPTSIYSDHTLSPLSPIPDTSTASSRDGCQNWWLRSWYYQHQSGGRGEAQEDVTHRTTTAREAFATGDHLGSHPLHTDLTEQAHQGVLRGRKSSML